MHVCINCRLLIPPLVLLQSLVHLEYVSSPGHQLVRLEYWFAPNVYYTLHVIDITCSGNIAKQNINRCAEVIYS